MEYKSFPAEFKMVDEAQGIVELYAAVFNNLDMGKDVIRLGAFDKSVQRKKPKGVWMHDGTATVAKTLETYPVHAGDPRLPPQIAGLGGQYVKGQFNLNTQRGRDAFSDIQFGIVDEFSIGYFPINPKSLPDGSRELSEIHWLEWSPVLAGMNPLAQLVSAKSREDQDILVDGASFAQDLAAVVDAAKRIATRATARKELRVKAGRVLSGANVSTLQDLSGTLKDSHVSIQAVFEAIDALVDSALGEPEDTEPKSIDPETVKRQIRLIRSRLALVG